MSEMNHDKLDRALEAALAKYAAVEARGGLEERILANLRAEQERVPQRAWWGWAVVAALAVVVLAVTFAWRSGNTQHAQIAKHQTASNSAPVAIAKSSSSNGAGSSHHLAPPRKMPTHHAALRMVSAGNPKLEQFPSPQPLSEQEKMLLDYVRRYHDEAVLIAEAREKERQEFLQQKANDSKKEKGND